MTSVMKTLAQKGIIRIACTVIRHRLFFRIGQPSQRLLARSFFGYFSRQPEGDGLRPLSVDGIYRLDANRLHGGDA
jgi:hypothetical protein